MPMNFETFTDLKLWSERVLIKEGSSGHLPPADGRRWFIPLELWSPGAMRLLVCHPSLFQLEVAAER